VGQDHGTLNQSGSARSDWCLRPRACLRKGCAQTYQPLRWNQRYCQDPDCLRALRRWQAARRQREHRRSPKNRQRHASTEAARRQRQRETSKTTGQDKNLRPPDTRRAWSRSKNNSQDLCGRPGCYEAPRASYRAPSRYCGDDCRQAIRRVRDRERKWLIRNRVATCGKRGTGRKTRSQTSQSVPRNPCASSRDGGSFSVGDYRASNHDGLSCHSHQPRENHHDDDPKTHPCFRPRSPPTR